MRAKPWSSRAAGHQLVVSPSLQPPSNHSKTNKHSDEPMTDRNGRREEANGRRRVAVWPYQPPPPLLWGVGMGGAEGLDDWIGGWLGFTCLIYLCEWALFLWASWTTCIKNKAHILFNRVTMGSGDGGR